MKNTTLLLLVLLLGYNVANCQEVLLEETVSNDSIEPLYGRNYPHFLHLYVNYGLIMGPNNEGSKIIYGRSSNRSIGLRYKGKLNNVVALGSDLSYQHTSYLLFQDTSKVLPSNNLYKKEKLVVHQIALGFYLRTNWGKRGNFIGNFIDLGGNFHIPVNSVHQTKDTFKQPTENGGTVVKTKTTGLDFIRPYFSTAIVRFGINRFVLTGTYRITDLFKKADIQESSYPEFPNMIIGLEIGFHK